MSNLGNQNKPSRIWVVDDDPIFHLMLKKQVEMRFNALVEREFYEGKNALAAVFAAKMDELPQFIFLDLHMPILDGWSFLHALKEARPEENWPFKVVVFSSTQNPDDFVRVSEFKTIAGFMNKRLDANQLDGVIRN